MATYIHDLKDWPKFRWSHEALAAPVGGRPVSAKAGSSNVWKGSASNSVRKPSSNR